MKCLLVAGVVAVGVSPSMRREWIEIHCTDTRLAHDLSPSMRREWIEMFVRI